MQQIEKAANRGTVLVRQLLAFGRQQGLQPIMVDLNAVVADMMKILQRLIGEDIELVTILEPALWRIKADPGQLEQIIMNLVVNARDAMPHGGRLTIETANVELGHTYAHRRLQVRPGPYVRLAVSDTGCGMDSETQARIFEPFFTTKEQGKGTGLGLSTVYSIVKQHEGYIWVYSEPGYGTTFKIYLPRATEHQPVSARQSQLSGAPRGSETVLVVEDDFEIRTLISEFLRKYGYTVLEAAHADEALQLSAQHATSIHLLVTDVILPQVNGQTLAMRLRTVHPETRVLYISGYTAPMIMHRGLLAVGAAFLQKPFTPDTLARKVREVLDAP